MTLEQILADAAAQADHLRRFGHGMQAVPLDEVVSQIRALPEVRSFLTWHSEANAADLSGNAPAWFRSRFAYFQKLGGAKAEGRTRYYREFLVRAVARRADLRAAHDEARDAAREDEAA